jgi:putative intracellular protease/amidase
MSMKLKHILWAIVGLLALGLVGFTGWIFMLPPAPAAAAQPPIAETETTGILAALKAPKRERPVIAIIGINDATEVTDYLMPYGILKRADVADVVAVATEEGPVQLYPALKVEPDATVAEFDAKFPEGADYVIVPAMSRNDDPAALAWIKAQAEKGATVIGVCVGVLVVAETGLLDGKRATTHWYYLDGLLEKHPAISYVANRRVVIDQNLATTTGITASMPAMLTLIEAIGGRAKAEEVAQGLGMPVWDIRHDSGAFKFNRPFAMTALGNTAVFWNRETFGIKLTPGIDEVTLALVADAWSRTYRSSALTFAASADAVTSANGLRILPDQVAESWPEKTQITQLGSQPPAKALDAALEAIEARYGNRTANLVAMQLEYPKQAASQ